MRVEQRDDPKIIEPTDAVIRLSATCVCGSDLWPYRGIEAVDGPAPMGHEYVGIVEEVDSDVRTITPGQFVIGSFFASDNTCEICRAGYQSSSVHCELIPSLLAASDVLGTGWFAAVAAEAGPGKTIAVVGDGAVGLLGVLAARQLGATDIVTERGEEGVARTKISPTGSGAHSVIEAVGTQESMMQAIRATRPGGHVGYVGVAHGVTSTRLAAYASTPSAPARSTRPWSPR